MNRIRRRIPTLVCLALAMLAAPVAAQRTPVEIDHVFVFTSPGALTEMAALSTAGFAVDTGTTRHTGQGTASRGVLFENAYLEFIWLDSTVASSGDAVAMMPRMRRAADWRTSGTSPFGLGLRRLDHTADYGVEAHPYSADWMEPGTTIEFLLQPSEPDAFETFVVPGYMALPGWIEQVRTHAPQLLAHGNGARRIVGIEIHGPVGQRPLVAGTLPIPHLRYVEAEEPLLVVVVDGGGAGTIADLRPRAPVVIRR